jgi:hydroxymethylbilane synthase
MLRLGSRGSQLALFQARLVADRIQSAGGPASEIVTIRTSGDRLQDAPLSQIGGKRLFVKEIEDALLDGEIDLAVHSSKDMPAALPDGLVVGAVLPRENPADALVLPATFGKDAVTLDAIRATLGPTARVGTGSVRRIAQLRSLFPQARFENVRGNLDTRVRKLDAGDYDALVLAAAGLRRLGLSGRISLTFSIDACVPAPGQGIIAVEIRESDVATRNAIAIINDADAASALEAERALVIALGGGCQMPLGGIAQASGGHDLELRAIVASLDGVRVIRYKKVGAKGQAASLGREVAEHLLAAGAAEILNEARRIESQVPNREPRQLT